MEMNFDISIFETKNAQQSRVGDIFKGPCLICYGFEEIIFIYRESKLFFECKCLKCESLINFKNYYTQNEFRYLLSYHNGYSFTYFDNKCLIYFKTKLILILSINDNIFDMIKNYEIIK